MNNPNASPIPVQQGPTMNLVPGVMHCARCTFRLVRSILSAVDGTTAAGDSKTEPCPNGCGPLWPVTWEQEAREAWARAEEFLARAVKAEAATSAPAGERITYLSLAAIRACGGDKAAEDALVANYDRDPMRYGTTVAVTNPNASPISVQATQAPEPVTMEQPNAPKRACRFVLDLQADSRQELADALYNIASRIERGEMTKGVSGGYSSGYIYELVENDRPTHDEFVQQLSAYLGAQNDAVPGVPVTPADPKPYALCRREGGCVCGGDTPRVRAGCSWWKGGT